MASGSLPFSASRKLQGSGLFLGFCFAGLCIVSALGLGFWYMIAPRLLEFHRFYFYLTGAAVLSFLFILSGGFTLIVLTVITGWDFLYPHGKKSLTVGVLFPIATFLSMFLRISRDRLRQSFVSVNNAMTLAQRKRISGERLLILLPHCIQIDRCNRNVTNNIDHCQACGQCLVGELRAIAVSCGISVNVVNGGTLARKRVVELRPTGIVAVACERDLTLGIQDVYPVPVIGIINDRPHGPCHNTTVDMGQVKEAVGFFKKPKS